MEQVYPRHAVLIVASSIAVRTCVRPVRWGVDVIAEMLGRSTHALRAPRVGAMSVGWLRQHEADFDKHKA